MSAACHPACALGPDACHAGSREYCCQTTSGDSLPFPGELMLRDPQDSATAVVAEVERRAQAEAAAHASAVADRLAEDARRRSRAAALLEAACTIENRLDALTNPDLDHRSLLPTVSTGDLLAAMRDLVTEYRARATAAHPQHAAEHDREADRA